MEDDYNILGQFENLSGFNLAKKLMKAPPKPVEAKTLDESFDSLSDLERTIHFGNPGKRPPKVTKLKNSEGKQATLKAPIETPIIEKENEVGAIARRTRSSGSLSKSISETSISSNSVSSVTKSKRANRRNNSTSNTPNEAQATAPKTRGRKKATRAQSSVEQNPNVVTQVDSVMPPLNPPRNVMRARRNHIAERACRCPTVDVVDLISSPMPRVEGFISLDSDEEVDKVVPSMKSYGNLETYFDAENPEIPIKIMWNAQPEVFTLRRHQKFGDIFDQLAKREKTDKGQIFLNLDNKIIQTTDTPASIDYKIFQFIHGRAMIDSAFAGASSLLKKKRDKNVLVLKVQSDKWKKPLSIEMQKTEQFKKLIIKCSEELKMSYENIKLYFDGEPLPLDQTPMDLEFEGGEILEIHLKDNA